VAKDGAVGATQGQEAAAGAFAEPKAPPPESSKKLLFIIAPLLLLLLAGGGGYFFFAGNKQAEPAAAAPEPPPPPAVYYKLPDFIVNLTSGARPTILKLTVSLEIAEAADVARVQASMPRIVSSVYGLLRELRPEELRGTANLIRLREELVSRVNFAAQPAKISNVLYQDILLQ
jgi:flagellar FliL protein